MAAVGGTEVLVTDIGIARDVDCDKLRRRKVRYGTADFVKEPAMTENETLQAIGEGIRWVQECKEMGYRVLGTGEMGIGNTTTAAAVGCALLTLSPEEVIGRGAELDDAGLLRKKEESGRRLRRRDFCRG